MAVSAPSVPVATHLPPPSGCSSGKQRRVAPVSSLSAFSCSSLPSHAHRAHLPAPTAALSSSMLVTSSMFSSRNAFASTSICAWMSSKRPRTCATRLSASHDTPKVLPSLPGRSRRATTTASFSTSLGPSSMRTGTPRISYWLNFQPGRSLSLASSSTRTPAALRSRVTRSAASTIASRCFSFCQMGMTTTCVGAIAGGRRSPASSPCVMMSPPTMRVDTPHDVCHTCRCSPSSSWNCVPKALAKFCPRLWLVPACSALRSPIIASIVYVWSAPANFSMRLLRPQMTGMASTPSASSRYTSSICSVSASASSCVACAVWPSCHRNSSVRTNGRVRISQRTTLAHWLTSSGRSRYELTHWLNIWLTTVSEVGRTTSGSSSSLPPPCVTSASSGAKPSTWSASLAMNEYGMNEGK
mmetsp:Transcript_22814/g.70485  ORF Transcript_22814/g.70485 Transcript_22814/m.70485 type:complete len:413 (+) Transcript_22814:169-1407(+)